MQLNQATDYAFRVVLYLACVPGNIVSGQIIAEQQSIPPQYLQKIMRSLAQAGLVRSHRGSEGGFELLRPAGAITLLDVIVAMEGPICLNRCLAEQSSCTRCCSDVCTVHSALGKIQDQFLLSLSRVNFEELANRKEGEVEK